MRHEWAVATVIGNDLELCQKLKDIENHEWQIFTILHEHNLGHEGHDVGYRVIYRRPSVLKAKSKGKVAL